MGSPPDVLALQRLVGNRAVERLLADRSQTPSGGVATGHRQRPVPINAVRPVIRRKLSDPDAIRLGTAFPDLPSLVAYAADKAANYVEAQMVLQYATGGSLSGPTWNALKPKINEIGPTLDALRAAKAQGVSPAAIDRCWTDLIAYPAGNRTVIANEIKAVLAKQQIGEPGLVHLLESFKTTKLTGEPDLKGRVAKAPRIDFFSRYKIGERLGTLGYESVVDKVAVIPPAAGPAVKGDTTGYVVNVATIPSDPSPKTIAEKYGNQGFADKSQAAKRLGLVVGVNRFKSLNGKSEDAVRAHANDIGAPGFNVRSFGFTWQLNWESLDDAVEPHGYAGAKAAYDQQDEPTKQRVLAEEKANLDQKHIPYGLIKERVTASPLTKELVTELAKHNKRVYIHLGDADAVSLLAPEEQKSVAGELKDKGGTKLTALFDRYDKIVEEKGNPLMAIGGYEFRLRGVSEEGAAKPEKGDLKRAVVGDNLTYLANQLDEAVRIAIASIKPEAVYPTEPNLIFLADDSKSNLYNLDVFNPDGTIKTEGDLMGTGAREGRKLEQKLIKARERAGITAPDNKVAYDPRASIATGSTRFRLGPESKKQQGKGKEYKTDREEAYTQGIRGSSDTQGFAKGKQAFKAQVIEDIIQQTQSFVDPRAFSREVGEAIPLKPRANLQKFSHRVSNHIYKKLMANKEKYKAKSVFKAPSGAKPPTAEETEVEQIIAAIETKLTSPDLDWLWVDLGKAIDDLYIAAGHT